MPSKAPSLEALQKAVREGRVIVHVRRATNAVAQALECDGRSAQAFILHEVAEELDRDAFVEVRFLSFERIRHAVVYAHVDSEGRGWYVKMHFDEEQQCVVVSFHPPDHELRRRDGGLVKPW